MKGTLSHSQGSPARSRNSKASALKFTVIVGGALVAACVINYVSKNADNTRRISAEELAHQAILDRHAAALMRLAAIEHRLAERANMPRLPVPVVAPIAERYLRSRVITERLGSAELPARLERIERYLDEIDARSRSDSQDPTAPPPPLETNQ